MVKKTILVVDDTDWNRDLLVQLLEEDYTVLQAVDGEQGVKMTQEEKPDLILMDLGMPVMDGWEATRRIKANDCAQTNSDHRRHFSRHGGRRNRGAQGGLRRLPAQTHRRRPPAAKNQESSSADVIFDFRFWIGEAKGDDSDSAGGSAT